MIGAIGQCIAFLQRYDDYDNGVMKMPLKYVTLFVGQWR
jgi:hypothetical protein